MSKAEKIIELFEKETLDAKISVFESLREVLEKSIAAKRAELASQIHAYQDIEESIKKQ